jgi:hypothetical protein
MAPYSRNCAKPFSACLFVIAAVKVVYNIVSGCIDVQSKFMYLSVVDVANCTLSPSVSDLFVDL